MLSYFTEFKTSLSNDLLLFQGQILELCSSLKSIYHKILVRKHDNDAALLSFQRLLYNDDIHRLNSKRLKFDCKDIIHITRNNDILILNRLCYNNIPSSQSGAVSASNMASASRTGGNFHPSAFIRFSVSYESKQKRSFNQTGCLVFLLNTTLLNFFKIIKRSPLLP